MLLLLFLGTCGKSCQNQHDTLKILRFSQKFNLSYRSKFFVVKRRAGVRWNRKGLYYWVRSTISNLCVHIKHTFGTHKARPKLTDFQNLHFFINLVLGMAYVCYMCAWCVHIFMVLKTQNHRVLRFQRTHLRLFTTKTRFC